jgi:tetratricopeptide (TPR) repeat protein
MKRLPTLLLAASLAVPAALAQSNPPPTAPPPTLQQGLTALRAHQSQQALDIFQQILRANPSDVTANLLAATAALNLYKGDLAVQYAEKAHALDPQNWKIHTTLVVAYSQAGDKTRRDQERAILQKLHDDPHAADAMHTSGFLLDMFPVKQYHVDAVQYFHPVGKFHIYYHFIVRNADGKALWSFDAASNDFDENSWARAYPARAAAGERQFQLTGQGSGVERDYGTFSGKPNYGLFRARVVFVLQSQTAPFPGE